METATARNVQHTYASPGTYRVSVDVTDTNGAVSTRLRMWQCPQPPCRAVGGRSCRSRTPSFPARYTQVRVTVRLRYQWHGNAGGPLRTLTKAVAASSVGDSIILRSGTYPISANTTLIQKNKLTITAFPGEAPVSTASSTRPAAVATEVCCSFDYQPMPAGIGEGLNLSSLPTPTFAGAQATGRCARRLALRHWQHELHDPRTDGR